MINVGNTKVDVVVPFYNRSSFLQRLLDSVAAQTYSVNKIFIIDNGSKDDEAQKAWGIICSHYLFSKCCFISTIKVGNANYARNLGYNLSCARYIAYLDSDDWWGACHIENSVLLLEKSKKSGCYSGAGIHAYDKSWTDASKDISMIGCPFLFLFTNEGGVAQSSSFVVSKDKVRNLISWDENLKRSQDYDFFISLEKKTTGWLYNPSPESHIDWNDGGYSGSIDEDSAVYFYKKWKHVMPRGVVDRFFLRNLLVLELKGSRAAQLKLRQAYLTSSSKNIYPIKYALSSRIVLVIFSKIISLKLFLKR